MLSRSASLCLLVGLSAFVCCTFTTTVSYAQQQREISTTPNSADDGAQQPSKRAQYTIRKDHDPNGIGKFYHDREIAHVMGYLAAPWLERPQREGEEKLSKLINALNIKPGMVVADIGAGSGVISVMMARKVVPGGKVLAVDIQEEMLSLLSKKTKQMKITNIEPVLGTIKSPNLKPGTVDLAIMVDVYHEFSFPYEMMLTLSKAMKPGGRIAFVEYRREDPKVRKLIKLVHTMTEAQVKKEIGQPEFRLKWKQTIDVLPLQHIVLFERIGEAAETRD